jgi:hypothetical protein
MSPLHRTLRRLRTLMVAGWLFASGLVLLAHVAIFALIFGLIDSFVGFETSTRTTISWVFAIYIALSAVGSLIRDLQRSSLDAAHAADIALGDPRRPVAAALSLRTEEISPMAEMLTQRSLQSASALLATIPSRKFFSWDHIARAAVFLAIPLLALVVFRLAAPAAFSTLADRLLHPATDIPPHSSLVFNIEPANPTAVYGGELRVVATITGGELAHPVECLVRRPRVGEILRLPAFRESDHRFSRKLDGLTEPIEIAIACGKARSHWLPVEILLEPRILSGIARLTPPCYTGLPTTEFPLDTNAIAAIEGSTVVLEITSNRPLATGSLVFTSATAPGVEPAPESIAGEITSSHSASFTLTATRPGRISATVADLRGTPAPEPLDLALRLIPDRPPVVELTSPPRQLLATPRSIIPVTGTAEDDFALSRLQFVRTLSGFRDRVRVVAPELRDKTSQFDEKLDLDALGLEPGQTIELMLEASDHNPSLLGHGSSEISRIRIISEDQYAAYIRAKTTLAKFSTRFEAAREPIKRSRESLKNLQKALEENDRDTAVETLKQALEAHRQAADLLDRIAGDFSAFELEKRLQKLAEKQADDLRENLDALAEIDPALGADQAPAIDEMLDRLGRQQAQQQQLDDDVEFTRQVASLLEMAAKFRRIYEAQVSVTKRFETIVREFRLGQNQNRRLLPSLADTQTKNREALDAFKLELKSRLDAIEDLASLAALVDSATDFLAELETAAPETLMDAAASHGQAGQALEAFTQADLARQLLERLMSQPGAFPEAAMGKAPEFELPMPDVNANIAQMLEALLGNNPGNQPGQGQGQNQNQGGAGIGGSSPQGAAMNGFPMDLPVVGPERLEFDPLADGTKPGGKGGNGGSGQVAPLPETAESGSIPQTSTRPGESTTLAPEAIPEAYREAVKRFLTP